MPEPAFRGSLSAMQQIRYIGYVSAPFTTQVERGRLRFFAKAISETDPVYTDEAAARAAGHPALPVPPTFFFCLEMDRPDPSTTSGSRCPRSCMVPSSFAITAWPMPGTR
jgi:hypothetical protein